mmetsp:Transcript_23740/g.66546  ORF Transcript_23740/g.66546 Transcript_23740/m.66546 type:complete len:244 (-) Transcript_23740:38-769(-)
MHFSASWQMLPMISTAGTGNLPAAVSPESITQSVPSSTALATSVASARVGLGLLHMDSSICVAVTTGLPAWLHFWMMTFCTWNIFSRGTSIPRSPRATMTASLSRTMSSMFSNASMFSTLEMTRMKRPSGPSASRISPRSPPFLTKDAATKSIPFFTPHARSSLSFSVSTGRSTTTPGRLQFLRSPMVAVLRHRASTVPAASSQLSTSRMSVPSAIRILLPGRRSRATLRYDSAMVRSSPSTE